jgi:formyltetrahydrofolate deformylase
LRIEITATTFPFDRGAFEENFSEVANRFTMRWHVSDSREKKRILIFVSREDHCLYDLLYRWERGDLHCEVVGVVSNHNDLEKSALRYDVPFHWIEVPESGLKEKDEAFKKMYAIAKDQKADVVVLARFMQILPTWFCEAYEGRMLNIHHSFLPSFAGARPYHQAFERGVKLIGATCHYATGNLDQGPIIEQDTERIDHTDTPDDLLRIGKDIERTVLARALRWHVEDRVLINGARTVVFR